MYRSVEAARRQRSETECYNRVRPHYIPHHPKQGKEKKCRLWGKFCHDVSGLFAEGNGGACCVDFGDESEQVQPGALAVFDVVQEFIQRIGEEVCEKERVEYYEDGSRRVLTYDEYGDMQSNTVYLADGSIKE